MTPEQGKTYEFELSDGTKLTVRFDGFGQWMAPIWFDPATGATINTLPPYKSYKMVN